MTPTTFPECNAQFTAPPDLDESQVQTIPAFIGTVTHGSMDGSEVCVVAWMPTKEDVEKICRGLPIFITMVGGLAPHYPSMSFDEATHPA